MLVVGATRENRAETLASLRRAFLIGGPIALLLTSLGAYLLAGAALRPIEAMRRRAAEISTSSLDERLPVSEASDEVARLGKTLNEMLARIEDGLARERRFVADASHELRTPLAMLQGRARPRSTPRAITGGARALDSIGRPGDRPPGEDRRRLALARPDGPQGGFPSSPSPPTSSTCSRRSPPALAPRAETEGRSLSVESAAAPVANVDRLRLEQALGNLVDNAFRYGRGPITLSAEVADSTVELHVLDGGPGFPAAFREHAFERFSRSAEPGEEGSGLGLAIVETIARAHGGRVDVADRPAGGADVWVSLPL